MKNKYLFHLVLSVIPYLQQLGTLWGIMNAICFTYQPSTEGSSRIDLYKGVIYRKYVCYERFVLS